MSQLSLAADVRLVIARSASDEANPVLLAAREAGLLRCARNDGYLRRSRSSQHHRPEIRKIPLPSGRGVKQRAGIGNLRICQDLRRRTLFDDAAMLHHSDVVTDLRRNAQ